MSEQEHFEAPAVQGMYCELKGEGTIKATVTLADVCLSIYSEVPILDYTERMVEARIKRLVSIAEVPVDVNAVKQDFIDLVNATSKVQKTRMSLRSGDSIITYALGEPVYDEKNGFLYLTPRHEGWWTHPNVEPIVQSIQKYFPDFEPWQLQRDKYIVILSQKSSLL